MSPGREKGRRLMHLLEGRGTSPARGLSGLEQGAKNGSMEAMHIQLYRCATLFIARKVGSDLRPFRLWEWMSFDWHG